MTKKQGLTVLLVLLFVSPVGAHGPGDKPGDKPKDGPTDGPEIRCEQPVCD